MTEILKEFVVQTPVWVWVILAYLIFRGIKARRPAKTSLLKLSIIPAIFTVWSLVDLVRLYGVGAQTMGLWLTGLAFGMLVGWQLLAQADIQGDRMAGVINRPADFTLLPLLMITFAVKYTFGAIAAISPDLLLNTTFRMADLLLSGAFTGIFIGKFIRYARAYRIAGAMIGA